MAQQTFVCSGFSLHSCNISIFLSMQCNMQNNFEDLCSGVLPAHGCCPHAAGSIEGLASWQALQMLSVILRCRWAPQMKNMHLSKQLAVPPSRRLHAMLLRCTSKSGCKAANMRRGLLQQTCDNEGPAALGSEGFGRARGGGSQHKDLLHNLGF
jgi:hypothetical protein